MNNLPELPPKFQNAFESVKTKAELEYATSAELFPHDQQLARFADALRLPSLIQKVFFAFCAQARNACQDGNWTVADVSRACDAAWPLIFDFYCVRERGACSEEAKSPLRVSLWRTIIDDLQWKQHLSDLEVLGAGASTDAASRDAAKGGVIKSTRDDSPDREKAPAKQNEHVALLDIILAKRPTTLAKWASAHKLGRTTVFDWKAAQVSGKPLKGKVSDSKIAAIEKAIDDDAKALGLVTRTDSD
jgi:hypothetical protein